VRDSTGCRYEFVIKSWANGTEHRRVFVLEQAGDFLRTHCVGVGDTVGICTDENGELVVEANTEAVRHATVSPKYGALALAPPPPGTASAPVPLAATMSGRCARSVHCAKPAGHPGRDVLTNNGHDKLVQTVRGMGYRFSENQEN